MVDEIKYLQTIVRFLQLAHTYRQMQSDSELLRQYLDCQSDEAFAGLVERHIDLVYSVAMRQTSNPHHAEEITQAVFIILARKAGQLRHDKALGSWLFETTRLTANNFIRSEMRRHYREQEACMHSAQDKLGHDEMWKRIGPVLDNAVASLNEKDRRAIVLRFYEGKTLSEVGVAMNGNEESARKRVGRAVERLQRFFSKRGMDSSAAVLGETISMNSVQAAPAALAKSVTSVAIGKGSAATGSMITLVKGTMNTMKWLKIKFAAGVGVAALITGGVVTVAISQTNQRNDSQMARAVVQKAQDAYAALSSYSDNGEITQNIGGQTLHTTFNIRMQRPHLYRIEWTQAINYFTNGGVAWSSGGNNYLKMGQRRMPQTYHDTRSVLAAAAGISGTVSSTIPAMFFNQDFNNFLRAGNATLLPDDTVDGVDCYVVSSDTGPTSGQGKTVHKMTTTLWIGKQDHLIRQVQSVMEGLSIKIPTMSDAEIVTMLRKQGQPVTPEAIAAARNRIKDGVRQAQKMITSSGKFVNTQTHRDISVNQRFSAADFDGAQ